MLHKNDKGVPFLNSIVNYLFRSPKKQIRTGVQRNQVPNVDPFKENLDVAKRKFEYSKINSSVFDLREISSKSAYEWSF